jgi:hypothetical protein
VPRAQSPGGGHISIRFAVGCLYDGFNADVYMIGWYCSVVQISLWGVLKRIKDAEFRDI